MVEKIQKNQKMPVDSNICRLSSGKLKNSINFGNLKKNAGELESVKNAWDSLGYKKISAKTIPNFSPKTPSHFKPTYNCSK